mmetsp:Transcript_8799/g.19345  ORF Transcript_8799/g.19345 Transcript_8799/m.19345 type:complete len:601 (+) Transcript_8799:95-1897(+)
MKETLSSNVTPYLAEFLGTFILVFASGCNAAVGGAVWGPCSSGAILAGITYAFYGASGAHLNPAVSLAHALQARVSFTKAIVYGGIQIAAGFFGAVASRLVVGETPYAQPAEGFTWWETGLVEVFYTAMLCQVFLCVTVSRGTGPPNQYFGVAVGFAAMAAGYSGRHLGAGFLNPAFVMGLGLMGKVRGFLWGLFFVVCECCGAGLAAGFFGWCKIDPHRGLKEPSRGYTVHLKSFKAYNLKTKDTGLFNEVVDPYLVARLGPEENQTPHIRNSLNPVWEGSEFSLLAGPKGYLLEIEIKNNGIVHDNTLGSCQLPLADFPRDGWSRRRESLGEGAGMVDFEVLCEAVKSPSQATGPQAHELGGRLLAEFVGTFFVVFTVGLNILGLSTQPALAIGATLVSVTFAFRGACPGHFNPAVTLAVASAALHGPLGSEVGLFVIVQFLAALVASFFYVMVENWQTFPLEGAQGFDLARVGIAEGLFTAIFAYVVLALPTMTTSKTQAHNVAPEFTGLAIGLTFMGTNVAAAAISGGVLNPAIALGVATSHLVGGDSGEIAHCVLYIVSEVCGGALAAGLFIATHPSWYIPVMAPLTGVERASFP